MPVRRLLPDAHQMVGTGGPPCFSHVLPLQIARGCSGPPPFGDRPDRLRWNDTLKHAAGEEGGGGEPTSLSRWLPLEGTASSRSTPNLSAISFIRRVYWDRRSSTVISGARGNGSHFSRDATLASNSEAYWRASFRSSGLVSVVASCRAPSAKARSSAVVLMGHRPSLTVRHMADSK
jgi:hypothetical protein